MPEGKTGEQQKLVLDIRKLEVIDTFAFQHIASNAACSCKIIDQSVGKAILTIELTIESGAKVVIITKDGDGKEEEIAATNLQSSLKVPLIYIENKITAKKSGARELNLKFNFDEGVIDSLGSKPDGSQVSINITE